VKFSGPYCVNVLFVLVVQVHLFVVHGKNYMRFVVKYFLCVGSSGSTRPIHDYSSGPITQDGGQVESSILVEIVG
jgi:hypothetical protein